MANSMVVYKDLSVACLLMAGWPGSNGWLVYIRLFVCLLLLASLDPLVMLKGPFTVDAC